MKCSMAFPVDYMRLPPINPVPILPSPEASFIIHENDSNKQIEAKFNQVAFKFDIEVGSTLVLISGKKPL